MRWRQWLSILTRKSLKWISFQLELNPYTTSLNIVLWILYIFLVRWACLLHHSKWMLNFWSLPVVPFQILFPPKWFNKRHFIQQNVMMFRRTFERYSCFTSCFKIFFFLLFFKKEFKPNVNGWTTNFSLQVMSMHSWIGSIWLFFTKCSG